MKTKALFCLLLIPFIASVALAQSGSKGNPRPDCGPIKKPVTDWVQFGFDPSLTGYNPYETILSPATVGNLGLEWQNSIAAPSNLSVVNGVLYLATSNFNGPNYVYALNASNGCVIRTYTADLNGSLLGSIAVVNGVVYAAGGGYYIYAWNAGDGTLLWKYMNPGGDWGYPTVANGVLYIGSSGGYANGLYALDAGTGEVLWESLVGAVETWAAVANGVVYFTAGFNNIYALNANTGQLLWNVQYGQPYLSSPTVANGIVYVASGVGTGYSNLYALDAGTGSEIWEFSLYPASPPPVAIANGVAYVSGVGMFALNASTGALIWHSPYACCSAPTVANGIVYSGDDGPGDMYALDASSGAVLWSYHGCETSEAVVTDGVLYLNAGNAVCAFHLPNQWNRREGHAAPRPD